MEIDEDFPQLPNGPTFTMWRIKGSSVVPWTDIGGFRSSHCYIIYSAVASGRRNQLTRDIYVWIGSTTPPEDEETTEAKASELEVLFKGDPNRYREVQYHESDEFHFLFRPYGGVRYLDGPAAAEAQESLAPPDVSLYLVKGQHNPVLLMVPATGKSLNHGDAFVVVSPKKIILWIGKDANRAKQLKGAHVVDTFATKYPKAKRVRLDKSETTEEFWAMLGGATTIADDCLMGTDSEVEAANVLKLFTVEGSTVKLFAEGVKVKRETLNTDLNNPKAVFVIQRGQHVMVFLQKRTAPEVKKQAIGVGTTFLSDQKLPSWYPIMVVQEWRCDDRLDVLFA
jgi:hypothetical protein